MDNKWWNQIGEEVIINACRAEVVKRLLDTIDKN